MRAADVREIPRTYEGWPHWPVGSRFGATFRRLRASRMLSPYRVASRVELLSERELLLIEDGLSTPASNIAGELLQALIETRRLSDRELVEALRAIEAPEQHWPAWCERMGVAVPDAEAERQADECRRSRMERILVTTEPGAVRNAVSAIHRHLTLELDAETYLTDLLELARQRGVHVTLNIAVAVGGGS